jgi:hypothetical protein
VAFLSGLCFIVSHQGNPPCAHIQISGISNDVTNISFVD